MAKSFLSKLNTLVQASIRDTVPSLRRLGKNLDKEVGSLRQQLDSASQEASQYEAQIAALQEEVLRWDEQADSAVANGQDAQARYAIQQMELAKQRLTIAQSELEQHHFAVHDLMRQINQLESMLQAAQNQQPEETSEQEPTLADAIQQARQTAASEPVHIPLDETVDAEIVEHDLALRRDRLKKPGS